MDDMTKINETEELEEKVSTITIDDTTGEHRIFETSEVEDSEDNSFDRLVEKINSEEDEILDDSPITEDEAVSYLNENKDSTLKGLNNDKDISIESTRVLLEVVNRKLKGEKFNSYRELPEEIQNIINNYINENGGLPGVSIKDLNSIKKNIADALLDEFINDVQFNRAKNDFAKELEELYRTSSKEIADSSLEYIEERNKAYREAAEEIEDETKKARLISILDRIDTARDLSELKEFSKTCKIKPIELEKPQQRAYSSFLNKYKNSNNNIYDINLARNVLFRHISVDGYTEKDVDAFFIAFCKQVSKYSVLSATDHAYMYYVLYYCAMLDGDKSSIFKDNVKEVINNLRERNNYHK